MRTLCLGGLFALLLVVQAGTGAPVQGSLTGQARVAPNSSFNLVKDFKGGERACVIITGDGSSYLGLYVYDADGNCIARDDRASYQTRDDAAVDWYPPQTGRYTIEVKNLGVLKNTFKIAVQ